MLPLDPFGRSRLPPSVAPAGRPRARCTSSCADRAAGPGRAADVGAGRAHAQVLLAAGVGAGGALGAVLRLCAGQPLDGDAAAVGDALAGALADPNLGALEIALGLPRAADDRRRLLRDVWLRQGVALAGAQLAERDRGPWNAVVAFASAWERFVDRGRWRQWRDETMPPPGASPLETALFWVSWYSRGRALSARQVLRLITATDIRGRCDVSGGQSTVQPWALEDS